MSGRPAVLDRWHTAFAARDIGLVAALLADDVVFRSPAIFAPQEGKAVTTGYLQAALIVLGPSMRYTAEWHDGSSAVLEFEAELDGLQVHGVDMLRWNEQDLLTSVTVLARPLRGLHKLMEQMADALAAHR